MIMFALLLVASSPSGLSTETRSVQPLSESQIADEIVTICAANLFDQTQLRQATRQSPYGFGEEGKTLSGLRSNWNTTYGWVNYIESPSGSDKSYLPQCNLDAFTRHTIDQSAFELALTAALTAEFAAPPSLTKGKFGWTWHVVDNQGHPIQISWIRDADLGQQITVSVQKEQG